MPSSWTTVCSIAALVVTLAVTPAGAQDPPAAGAAAPAQAAAADLIRVFLDCNQCDSDYLRQNVGFVDYVRDRESADFHVLVTVQGTGGGGSSWRAQFIGLGRYAGQDFTLTFDTPSTATSDERREAFARHFKLGLASFAAATSAAPALNVTWTRPSASTTTPTRDPWNYWVFSVNTNGNINGEESSTSKSYNVNFSANRTTERLKLRFNSGGNLRESSFVVGEDENGGDETFVTRTHSWNINGQSVVSLTPRLSLGGTASVSHSSFNNIDRSIAMAPAIEYNFFPYSESSRRALTVQYAAGATRFQYAQLTIFDVTEETIPRHQVTAELDLRQPWGSASTTARFSQHLSHMDRSRFSVFGDADVRLFKGFSFNVFGEYSRIRDQVGLPKRNATDEEVLLRVRQLATGYSYFVAFGINYRFGSIFNNVVNTRMNASGF